jgi:hypothetical protein
MRQLKINVARSRAKADRVYRDKKTLKKIIDTFSTYALN